MYTKAILQWQGTVRYSARHAQKEHFGSEQMLV